MVLGSYPPDMFHISDNWNLIADKEQPQLLCQPQIGLEVRENQHAEDHKKASLRLSRASSAQPLSSLGLERLTYVGGEARMTMYCLTP